MNSYHWNISVILAYRVALALLIFGAFPAISVAEQYLPGIDTIKLSVPNHELFQGTVSFGHSVTPITLVKTISSIANRSVIFVGPSNEAFKALVEPILKDRAISAPEFARRINLTGGVILAFGGQSGGLAIVQGLPYSDIPTPTPPFSETDKYVKWQKFRVAFDQLSDAEKNDIESPDGLIIPTDLNAATPEVHQLIDALWKPWPLFTLTPVPVHSRVRLQLEVSQDTIFPDASNGSVRGWWHWISGETKDVPVFPSVIESDTTHWSVWQQKMMQIPDQDKQLSGIISAIEHATKFSSKVSPLIASPVLVGSSPSVRVGEVIEALQTSGLVDVRTLPEAKFIYCTEANINQYRVNSFLSKPDHDLYNALFFAAVQNNHVMIGPFATAVLTPRVSEMPYNWFAPLLGDYAPDEAWTATGLTLNATGQENASAIKSWLSTYALCRVFIRTGLCITATYENRISETPEYWAPYGMANTELPSNSK